MAAPQRASSWERVPPDYYRVAEEKTISWRGHMVTLPAGSRIDPNSYDGLAALEARGVKLKPCWVGHAAD